MRSFAFAVTRLVPLLLAVSVLLILARVVRDRLTARSAGAARGAFAGIVGLAAVIALAVFVQTGTGVAAQRAFDTRSWQRVDSAYRTYAAMRGPVSRRMSYEWGIALMHGAQWRRAAAMFERTGTPSPRGLLLNSDTTLLIAECLYYSGDLRRAEGALRVAQRARRAETRDYLLGRVADRSGRAADASAMYTAAVGENGRFLPAVYHRARLLASSGEYPDALQQLDAFAALEPAGRTNAAWRDAHDAVLRRAVPRDVEFYVLEE